MNLYDLDTFITTLQKKESIGENLSKFSRDFEVEERIYAENKDKKNADELIENIA